MNDVEAWAKLLGAVAAAVVAIGGLASVIVKRFPPRATGLAKEVADLKNDMRVLTDYVHDLREHIANGKPPPPPDWPEGLRL